MTPCPNCARYGRPSWVPTTVIVVDAGGIVAEASRAAGLVVLPHPDGGLWVWDRCHDCLGHQASCCDGGTAAG